MQVDLIPIFYPKEIDENLSQIIILNIYISILKYNLKLIKLYILS